MFRIFNQKLKKSILFDDSKDVIKLNPRTYEEGTPHVLIELHNFDLFRHSMTCEECKIFVNAFGKEDYDWRIEINGTTHRLKLSGFGNFYSDNKASFESNSFFQGTKLKLNIDTDTVESLKESLDILISEERYEECCPVRDKIKAFEKES